jgi:hypothetical protein
MPIWFGNTTTRYFTLRLFCRKLWRIFNESCCYCMQSSDWSKSTRTLVGK